MRAPVEEGSVSCRRKSGEKYEIHLLRIYRREEVGNNVRQRARRHAGRVLCLRRHAAEERSLCWRGSAAEPCECHHAAISERQGVHYRWPLCRNERAVRRNPCARSHGSEPRNPVNVEASRSEGRPFRDSPGCRLNRNGPRKRTAACGSKEKITFIFKNPRLGVKDETKYGQNGRPMRAPTRFRHVCNYTIVTCFLMLKWPERRRDPDQEFG